MFELISHALVTGLLFVLGWGLGTWLERRHFRALKRREVYFRTRVALLTLEEMNAHEAHTPCLVSGNVVISVDYFKRIMAMIKSLIGGQISHYESLLVRARREALLRMQAQAWDIGARHVAHVKITTTSVFKGYGQQLGAVEVYAYGTALLYLDNQCPDGTA